MIVDKEAIENGIYRIEEIFRSYPPQNVWNADELDPFYCQPPTCTPPKVATSGYKIYKMRLHFLACCKMMVPVGL